MISSGRKPSSAPWVCRTLPPSLFREALFLSTPMSRVLLQRWIQTTCQRIKMILCTAGVLPNGTRCAAHVRPFHRKVSSLTVIMVLLPCRLRTIPRTTPLHPLAILHLAAMILQRRNRGKPRRRSSSARTSFASSRRKDLEAPLEIRLMVTAVAMALVVLGRRLTDPVAV